MSIEILIFDNLKISERTKINRLEEKPCAGMTIHVAAKREQSRVYSAFVRDGAGAQNKRRDFVSS